jgi:hypothetical protein
VVGQDGGAKTAAASVRGPGALTLEELAQPSPMHRGDGTTNGTMNEVKG